MVCSEILYFLFFPPGVLFLVFGGGCPCAILTDRLARTQLTGLQGGAAEAGDPYIA